MSRLCDDATPDYFQTDTAVLTAAPFSVGAWFNTNDSGVNQAIAFLGDKDETEHAWKLLFRLGSLQWFIQAGGSAAVATATLDPSINVWHHALAVEASTTSRAVYLDGGNKGTNASTRDVQGADRTAVGREADSVPSREFSGLLAHIAWWNVALTDSEVASLGAGVSPLNIRRDNLVSYVPLNGVHSPETDVVGGVDLTVFGTPSQGFEPPIPNSLVAI